MIGILLAAAVALPVPDVAAHWVTAIDMSPSLAFGSPPCGTPEALKYDRCVNWKMVPCEETMVGSVDHNQPIGCDAGGAKPLPKTAGVPSDWQRPDSGGIPQPIMQGEWPVPVDVTGHATEAKPKTASVLMMIYGTMAPMGIPDDVFMTHEACVAERDKVNAIKGMPDSVTVECYDVAAPDRLP